MSLMKRYASDMETLTLRAAYAAWEPTAALRAKALDSLFQDCASSAQIYADPGHAAKTFVRAVVREFMEQRKRTTYKLAG